MKVKRKGVGIAVGSVFILGLIVLCLFHFEDWMKRRAARRRIEADNGAIQHELHMIHFTLEAYNAFRDKPPPASLDQMERDPTAKSLLASYGIQPKIRAGRYMVLWGTPTVTFKETTIGETLPIESNRILLAYDKEPDPEARRNVLTSETAVRGR